MRKFILTAVFLAGGTALFAQNLEKVQDLISKQKYADAKNEIDKIVASSKGQNSANAWYYKGVIYNELAKDSTQDNSAFRLEAYNALKKGQELDPKNTMGELEQNWRMFDIYNHYLNTAIKKHNTKDYAGAMSDYKTAFDVQRYINQKGFSYNNQTLPALDTALTLYAGSAAFMAKDSAAGAQYFQQLADAKVGGKEYMEAYQMLVDYYNRRGDHANAQKYATMGQQLYPQSEYWTYYELQDPALREDKTKLLAKYEEVLARNPENSSLALDYAIEMFNFTYGQTKPSDYKGAQARLDSAIQKAVNVNKSAEANFLMVQHISNQIYDLQESQRAIKGTKPEDIKRKNAFTADINKKYEQMVTFGETAAQQFAERSDLKAVEKANYKSVLSQLASYYRYKKQLDKAKTYEDRAKALGA